MHDSQLCDSATVCPALGALKAKRAAEYERVDYLLQEVGQRSKFEWPTSARQGHGANFNIEEANEEDGMCSPVTYDRRSHLTLFHLADEDIKYMKRDNLESEETNLGESISLLLATVFLYTRQSE